MKRLLALLVASVATTSALPTGQAAEPAAEILSVLDFYGIASCNPSALRGTISWSGTRPFQDGGCAPLPAGVQSVKVTKLVSTCAVTLYTDNYCSFNVTATSLGGCVSATASDVPFRSFSTDGCF